MIPGHGLRIRRLGIDTYREPVIYMHLDCPVCRSEGFEAHSRIEVTVGERHIIATLNVVHGDLMGPGEVGLSEAAWRLLEPAEGAIASFAHPPPLDSLSHVRAKVYGHDLDETMLEAIVTDLAAGHYADVHVASFLTACAGERLNPKEIAALTRAMIRAGERLAWPTAPIMDKHCVGGLPGNRTTLLVVPIVTAFGLTMPKTSSRAITSPAGTADTMETLAPVNLSIAAIRSVVEREGGCIVWGGVVQLSPADDVVIRVERSLDLDSEGQLVASVLSKKAAAGSTHVLIDLPVGPTAKVRSPAAAERLAGLLTTVGDRVGLVIRTVTTDGVQPVGRGIGPALEARDVLMVLRGDPGAPSDLRERGLLLAGRVLELSGRIAPNRGLAVARKILDEGRAWRKFQAICEAQGGFREPGAAPLTRILEADRRGRVARIDNRKLARAAKLAGAPGDKTAGLYLEARIGDSVEPGQPLFTLHAETRGELEYAWEYVRRHRDIVTIAQ